MDTLPLIENQIQKHALDFLANKYYKGCSFHGQIYSKTESYTRDGKRADGLIVFVKEGAKYFVVSLEAKSVKTLSQLTPHPDAFLLLKTALGVSSIVIIGLSLKLHSYGYNPIMEPINVICMLLLFFLFTYGSTRLMAPLKLIPHNSVPVLEQLKQYPADESWIAIGSTDFKNRKAFLKFKWQCMHEGVGVLEVTPNGKVKIKVYPEWSVFSDDKNYLAFYKDSSIIRSYLNSFGPVKHWKKYTPSEKHYWRLIAAAAIAIIMAFVIFFSIPKERSKDLPNIVDLDKPYQEKPQNDPEPIPSPEKINQGHSDIYIQEEKYIIKEGFFSEELKAQKRAQSLRNSGFPMANYLWLPNYKNELRIASFCVYLSPMLSSRHEAEAFIKELKKTSKYKELSSVEIIRINPLN